MRSKKALTLTDEMKNCAHAEGSLAGVSPSISEYDQLLGYFVNKAKMDPVQAVKSYFSGGKANADQVIAVMHSLNLIGDRKRVLEFAAGFGRVTRHLKAPLAQNIFSASDIHEEACSLIKEKIGVTVYQSSQSPLNLMIPEQDFIFVLSLFSHLPEKSFGAWLDKLYSRLSPGGVLLFTTHGEHALTSCGDFFMQNYDSKKGFGFRPESDQDDLPNTEYGTAVVSDEYVRSTIRRIAPTAKILGMKANVWFGLQDEWIIQRPSEFQTLSSVAGRSKNHSRNLR